ncbi:MAG: hypothetical protein EHM28_14510 [Spirochaetaceae bacterium]|nr:MAG: hypothetical protein EHM28_14510 [Spirochaetaceae bacterium]
MIKKRIITLMLGALSLFALFSLARCDIYVEYARITSPIDGSTTYDSLAHIEGYAHVNLDYYDTMETKLYINGVHVSTHYSTHFSSLELLDPGYNIITVKVYKNNAYWVSDSINVYYAN